MRNGSWSSGLPGRPAAAPDGRDGRAGLNPPISGYGRSVCPPPVLRVGWRTCRVAATGMVTWPLVPPRRPPGTAPGAFSVRSPSRDGRSILTGAIAPLNDLSGWARGNLLVIVLLVLG